MTAGDPAPVRVPAESSTRQVLPAAAWVADAFAGLLIAAAAWVAVVGGARYIVFDIVLRLNSPAIFLYAALSVLVVRHSLAPRPTAWQRLRAARESVLARP